MLSVHHQFAEHPRSTDWARFARSVQAFTLIELITVMGIIAVLMVVAVPAVQSMRSASNINKAATDLSNYLSLARSYAMSHQTYVRVGISQEDRTVTFLPVYSKVGTLEFSNSMGDAMAWPELAHPLTLRGLDLDETLGPEGDKVPSQSDLSDPFQRLLSSKSGAADFKTFIQFGPNGEARVEKAYLPRFVKIGMRGADREGANSFVVRLSASNGTVRVLRTGDGLQ